MPHICVLSSVHSPLDHRVRKEYRTLVQAGYDVTVVAPYGGDADVDGARIVGLPIPPSRRARMTRTIRHLASATRRLRPDAVHIHDPELLPLGLVLSGRGLPVIYDRHEDAPRDMLMTKDYLPVVLRYAASGVIWALERLGERAFAAIVLATEEMRPDLPWARRVIAVRNFPDLSMFEGQGRPSPDGGPLRLVYAGSVCEARGVTRLVEAMALLPQELDARLALWGPIDPPGYRKELEALPGWRRVRYGGVLDHTDVPAAMMDADVGLACLQPLETYLDAVPTKIYEYLAAGLPVIASDFPGYRAVVAGAACGVLVDPTDPRAIAEAIAGLGRDVARRREFGAAARAAASAYAWTGEGARLVALYDDILGHPG